MTAATTEPEIGPATVQYTSYSVEIDKADFIAIDKAESSWAISYETSLSARLEGINYGRTVKPEVEGISDVEYNGHFGNAIYYRVEAEDDTPELHEKIRGIIRDQILRARKASTQGDGDTED